MRYAAPGMRYAAPGMRYAALGMTAGVPAPLPIRLAQPMVE
jgi:hypothetical protein